MRFEERGGDRPVEEGVRPENGDQQVAVGRDASDLRALERRRQAEGRLLARRRVDDELGQHRVVVGAHDGAVLEGVVIADAIGLSPAVPAHHASRR